MPFPEFDLSLSLGHLLDLLIAYALASAIGWDQEKRSGAAAGLRTFPLVALGATSYVLAARSVLGADSEAIARILQGLITGIGFLGAGAILTREGKVLGLATAASLWNTCAIGAAVGLHRYEIAVVLTLANFVTLRWVSKVKDETPED